MAAAGAGGGGPADGGAASHSFLSTLVHKLSYELELYQLKFGPLPLDVPSQARARQTQLSGEGAAPAWLTNEYANAPLIRSLAQRSELLSRRAVEADKTIHDLTAQAAEIVEENERLHAELRDMAVDGVSKRDWDELREHLALLIEENKQVLERHQDSTQALAVYKEELERARKDLAGAVASKEKAWQETKRRGALIDGSGEEVARLQASVKLLKKQAAHLQQENSVLRAGAESFQQRGSGPRMSARDFQGALQDTTAAFESEQQRLAGANTGLSRRAREAEAEAKQLQQQLLDTKAALAELIGETKSIKRDLQRTQQLNHDLEGRLSDFEEEKLEAAQYLASLVQIVEQTQAERDALANLTAKSRVERDQYLSELHRKDVMLAKLAEKFKIAKVETEAELAEAAAAVRAERLERQRFETSVANELDAVQSARHNIARERQFLDEDRNLLSAKGRRLWQATLINERLA